MRRIFLTRVSNSSSVASRFRVLHRKHANTTFSGIYPCIVSTRSSVGESWECSPSPTRRDLVQYAQVGFDSHHSCTSLGESAYSRPSRLARSLAPLARCFPMARLRASRAIFCFLARYSGSLARRSRRAALMTSRITGLSRLSFSCFRWYSFTASLWAGSFWYLLRIDSRRHCLHHPLVPHSVVRFFSTPHRGQRFIVVCIPYDTQLGPKRQPPTGIA